MRLLLFDMGSYTYRDILQALEAAGHQVHTVYYHFADRYSDDYFTMRFTNELKRGAYDAVISVNFFPLVSLACEAQGLPYISWSYDSPLDEHLADYFDNSVNHIFLFDRLEVAAYRSAGHTNVYHLPLAVKVTATDTLASCYDISFVGKIYDSYLPDLLLPASDYVKGYVEALLQAQLGLIGCNILESAITDRLLDELNGTYEALGQNSLRLNRRGLAYAIDTQLTRLDRSILLETMSENHDVHFFSDDQVELASTVKRHGPVKYHTEMKQVFAASRLNLCPTLRSIASGIPLRALDIVGAGGVLFSNYQPELAEYFADGDSVIMYESLEDAIAKADYYLSHEDERSKIGHRGIEIAERAFSYEDRIEKLLSVI